MQLHALVNKLNEAFNRALAGNDIREKITTPANVAGGGTPEEFGAFIQAENKCWTTLVKSAGIKLEYPAQENKSNIGVHRQSTGLA